MVACGQCVAGRDQSEQALVRAFLAAAVGGGVSFVVGSVEIGDGGEEFNHLGLVAYAGARQGRGLFASGLGLGVGAGGQAKRGFFDVANFGLVPKLVIEVVLAECSEMARDCRRIVPVDEGVEALAGSSGIRRFCGHGRRRGNSCGRSNDCSRKMDFMAKGQGNCWGGLAAYGWKAEGGKINGKSVGRGLKKELNFSI